MRAEFPDSDPERGYRLPVYSKDAFEKARRKVVKPSQSRAILPSKRELVLKRINDMQNEVGRLNRLLDELRADVLELTIE